MSLNKAFLSTPRDDITISEGLHTAGGFSRMHGQGGGMEELWHGNFCSEHANVQIFRLKRLIAVILLASGLQKENYIKHWITMQSLVISHLRGTELE